MEEELYNLFRRQDLTKRGKLDRAEAKAFLETAVGAMAFDGASNKLNDIVHQLLRRSGGEFVDFKDVKDFVLGSAPPPLLGSARSSLHSGRSGGRKSSVGSIVSVQPQTVPDLTVLPVASGRARLGR